MKLIIATIGSRGIVDAEVLDAAEVARLLTAHDSASAAELSAADAGGDPSTSRDKRTTAEVILFKHSGKYGYTEEWRIPEGAIGPWDMRRSPDFRRTDGGTVLVTGGPWGFPHLL